MKGAGPGEAVAGGGGPGGAGATPEEAEAGGRLRCGSVAMSRQAKDDFLRHYTVSDPRTHPKGYTEYKVTAQFISKRDPEDVKEVRLLGGRGTIPPFQIWKRKGTTGHSARRPAPLPPWPWEEGTLCPVHTHPRTRLGVGRVKRP
uniref:Uncharacterized protein n=1 Tax=Equus asinus TaxID=9793 RepID=A0A9L0ISQ5_EQUAS